MKRRIINKMLALVVICFMITPLMILYTADIRWIVLGMIGAIVLIKADKKGY